MFGLQGQSCTMDKKSLTSLTACSIIYQDFGDGSVWLASHAKNLADQPLNVAAPHSCSAALPKTIGLTSLCVVSH